ncbi:hypothetical protein Taro_048744 [Colocasia esculenta]|uniref:ACT domain-containing protein n=1 Tax=Colocasia esculenta TaxID=4460 RepID=A0A843X8Y2_COLES|nr:hypothetical protein [Colocasia esculenta]
MLRRRASCIVRLADVAASAPSNSPPAPLPPPPRLQRPKCFPHRPPYRLRSTRAPPATFPKPTSKKKMRIEPTGHRGNNAVVKENPRLQLQGPVGILLLPAGLCRRGGVAAFVFVRDAVGIVAKLAECIASRGGNIHSVDVFVPEDKQVFYSRRILMGAAPSFLF